MMMRDSDFRQNRHLVAIIGGACSGAEASERLAHFGIETCIFEQNKLPYGKLQTGLPVWHTKLRNKSFTQIDRQLTNQFCHYVPCCRIGTDVSWGRLSSLGFSAIILAPGASRDRPLRVKGMDSLNDSSFAYQNDFMEWFNCERYNDPKNGKYQVTDGALIIGGGLASIDVAKACQFIMVQERLASMGLSVTVEDLEEQGIHNLLKTNGLVWDDLSLKPAMVSYRKRTIDMSLIPKQVSMTERQTSAYSRVVTRLLKSLESKYLIEILSEVSPVQVYSSGGNVTGVTCSRNVIKNGQIVGVEGYISVPTSFLVSSIGSLPSFLEELSLCSETYEVEGGIASRLKSFSNVFVVGNAVAGKGNIQASRRHSRNVSEIIGKNIGVSNYSHKDSSYSSDTGVELEHIIRELNSIPIPSSKTREKIFTFVNELQSKAGYCGDFFSWKKNCIRD